MTTKELQQLIELAVDAKLQEIVDKLKDEMYAQQIKDFKQHLENSMPREYEGEEGMTAFYDLQWQISFNGQTLTMTNEAAIYNGILDMVKDYIEYNI